MKIEARCCFVALLCFAAPSWGQVLYPPRYLPGPSLEWVCTSVPDAVGYLFWDSLRSRKVGWTNTAQDTVVIQRTRYQPGPHEEQACLFGGGPCNYKFQSGDSGEVAVASIRYDGTLGPWSAAQRYRFADNTVTPLMPASGEDGGVVNFNAWHDLYYATQLPINWMIVEWDRVDSASEYVIYRGVDGGWPMEFQRVMASEAHITIFDSLLSEGRTYEYYVAAAVPSGTLWSGPRRRSAQLEKPAVEVVSSSSGTQISFRVGKFGQFDPVREYLEVYFQPPGLAWDSRSFTTSDLSGDTLLFNLPDGIPSGELKFQFRRWASRNPELNREYSASAQLEITVNSTAVEQTDPSMPTEFRLEQNYPNPFNPETVIRYALPQASTVTLDVYNVLGQKVRTLVDHAPQPADFYLVSWDGRNDRGETVPSGIYYYRLQAGTFVEMKKMVLMK